jgi:hypothetical protein
MHFRELVSGDNSAQRSHEFVLITKYYWDHEVSEEYSDNACRAHRRDQAMKTVFGKSQRKRPLGRTGRRWG